MGLSVGTVKERMVAKDSFAKRRRRSRSDGDGRKAPPTRNWSKASISVCGYSRTQWFPRVLWSGLMVAAIPAMPVAAIVADTLELRIDGDPSVGTRVLVRPEDDLRSAAALRHAKFSPFPFVRIPAPPSRDNAGIV